MKKGNSEQPRQYIYKKLGKDLATLEIKEVEDHQKMFPWVPTFTSNKANMRQ